MRRSMVPAVVSAVLLAGSIGAEAQDPRHESTFKQQLEQWLPGMGADDVPDRQQSQQALQAAIFRLGAPGREAELTAACRAIAEKLGPETAKPARIWMLRQLESSGGAECVEAVAALLSDQDAQIRDSARRALENNPAPEANNRLLAALGSAADDTQRVAVANALGCRGNSSSVPALSGLLDHGNQAVVEAAANALGKIGGAQAAAALKAGWADAPQQSKPAIADAYLRSADKFLKEGKRGEAAGIYVELDNPDLARPIRLAAIQGTLNAAGDKAAEMVLKMLAGDDPDRQAIAAGYVENIIGPASVETAAEQFPKLPASGQVLLLAALAFQGDKSAMPVAVAALESPNHDVRLAGIQALGKLGDTSAVPVLIEAVRAGGNTGGPALESLREVYGDGVDEAIVSAVEKADNDLRGTLIDVLGDRRRAGAVPVLLKQAEHEDAGIRSRAMRALGNLAEANDVASMVAILLKREKGRERDDAEKAITLVSNRIPQVDSRADPVLAIIHSSTSEDRCVLLPLLGRIGGNSALKEVNEAIQSDNPQVQEAGVRALSNWPDASVANDLLELARHAENKAHGIWALRAYIRVVSLPSERPHQETLAMLKKAMEMAEQDDERRLVVSRASSARHVETLRWLVPLLDDPTVSGQASTAIVELAHHRELMDPNRAEFRKALEKVISVTTDQGLIDRAKRYISGL